MAQTPIIPISDLKISDYVIADLDDPAVAEHIAAMEPLMERYMREAFERALYSGEPVEVTCGGKRLYVVRPTLAGIQMDVN